MPSQDRCKCKNCQEFYKMTDAKQDKVRFKLVMPLNSLIREEPSLALTAEQRDDMRYTLLSLVRAWLCESTVQELEEKWGLE